MTSENFTYWCQGFVELTGGAHPTPEQWKMIKEHLALVFTKVTPPLEKPNSLVSKSSLKILDLLTDGPICGDAQPRKEEPHYCMSDHSRGYGLFEFKDDGLTNINFDHSKSDQAPMTFHSHTC